MLTTELYLITDGNIKTILISTDRKSPSSACACKTWKKKHGEKSD